MHKIEVCLQCQAEFHIKHDMDDGHYQVEFCPFCGERALEDESYVIEDDDEILDD